MFEIVLAGRDGAMGLMRYDPHDSTLIWSDTGERVDLSRIGLDYKEGKPRPDAHRVHRSDPGRKVAAARNIKIQLGLQCNYACSYCLQASQSHEQHGRPDDVPGLLAQIERNLDLGDGTGVYFDLRGGEPLVYWKTLKPLAEALRARYPKCSLRTITNGSLLDADKVLWLDQLGFAVAVSHDGPGYSEYRGSDPLDDPKSSAAIRLLFDRLAPSGRMNFNCVLTPHNPSLMATRQFIADKLGVMPTEVPLSTEGMVTPYDAMSAQSGYLNAHNEKIMLHSLFWEMIAQEGLKMGGAIDSLNSFFRSLAQGVSSSKLGQSCGMEKESSLAFDMRGEVITCQNTAPEGDHLLGKLDDLDKVRLTTAYHWSHRPECGHCPVLHLCRGGCFYVEDPYWSQACDNKFIFNMAHLAAALFVLTNGWVLTHIRGEKVRRDGIREVPVIDPLFVEQQGRVPWMKPRRTIPIQFESRHNTGRLFL